MKRKRKPGGGRKPQKRKRAPGGGRKPLGPLEGSREMLSHRVPFKLRKELKARARKHKRSLTREVLVLLEWALSRNRKQRKDIVALIEAIAIAIRYVEHATKEEWRNSAFTTAAVRRAVDSLLGRFGPQEAPKVPLAIKKHADYAERFSDPAKLGEQVAFQLFFELQARGGL